MLDLSSFNIPTSLRETLRQLELGNSPWLDRIGNAVINVRYALMQFKARCRSYFTTSFVRTGRSFTTDVAPNNAPTVRTPLDLVQALVETSDGREYAFDPCHKLFNQVFLETVQGSLSTATCELNPDVTIYPCGHPTKPVQYLIRNRVSGEFAIIDRHTLELLLLPKRTHP